MDNIALIVFIWSITITTVIDHIIQLNMESYMFYIGGSIMKTVKENINSKGF